MSDFRFDRPTGQNFDLIENIREGKLEEDNGDVLYELAVNFVEGGEWTFIIGLNFGKRW